MPLRDAICAEASTWVGTPYHKLACIKGVGADCTAMLWAIYTQYYPAPWTPYSYPPVRYQRLLSAEWRLHTHDEVLLDALREALPGLVEMDPPEAQPGDFLALGTPGRPAHHVGVLLPGALVIHACFTPGATRWTIKRERRHAALQKLERAAFRLRAPGEERHGHPC